MSRLLRIAVVSPFVDKTHGTERCVAEQLERLARKPNCEIALYSQSVTDLNIFNNQSTVGQGQIVWRKVPSIPGPQLVRYIWWFAANHVVRWFDCRSGEFRPDVVFSPGVNCLDADVIAVHIVFAEFVSRVREQLYLIRNPPASWPRLLHRRMYYRLIMALEYYVYRSKRILLAGVSKKVTRDIESMYGRQEGLSTIYHGIDARQFNPRARLSLRAAARSSLAVPKSIFVLLLVGNDWKKKGLITLLNAIARLENPAIWAFVVGHDDPGPYQSTLQSLNLEGRVRFMPIRSDVEWYYAVADAYVGPSLEDAFALPPLEAMACGVPVIVSREAGVCELVTHGDDGLILEDPIDAGTLSGLINTLISQPKLAATLGANAARTARKYGWEENAEQLFSLLLSVSR